MLLGIRMTFQLASRAKSKCFRMHGQGMAGSQRPTTKLPCLVRSRTYFPGANYPNQQCGYCSTANLVMGIAMSPSLNPVLANRYSNP